MSTQPAALAEFQRHRSATRREAVAKAIRSLNAASEPVNVSAVAARAGVDRSYIYDHPDLLKDIVRLREGDSRPLACRPAEERATEASLRARLAATHDELVRLRTENSELRRRLEETLGECWAGPPA